MDKQPFYDTDEKRDAFIQEALSWKGVPFFLNGRSRDGAGCAGMLAEIHHATGAVPHLELPIGTGREGDQRRIRRMSDWMKNLPCFEEADPAAPQIGDIVTFKLQAGEYHLGTWLGEIDGTPKSILHACPGYGASVSNLLDPTYEDNLVACWRIVK